MNVAAGILLMAAAAAGPALGEIRTFRTQLSTPHTSGCWAGWNTTAAIFSKPSVDILNNGHMQHANVTLGLLASNGCVAGAGSNGVAVFTGASFFYRRIIQFVDLRTGVAETYNDTDRLASQPMAAVGSSQMPRVVIVGRLVAEIINTETRTVDPQTLPFPSGGGHNSFAFAVTTASGREWLVITGGDRGRMTEALPLDAAELWNTSFVNTPNALAHDRQRYVHCASNGNALGTFVCTSIKSVIFGGFDDHDYCTITDDGIVSCVAIPVANDKAADVILPAGPVLLYAYSYIDTEVVDAVHLPSLSAPAPQTRVLTYDDMGAFWSPPAYMAMHAGNFAYIAGGGPDIQTRSSAIVFEYTTDATTESPVPSPRTVAPTSSTSSRVYNMTLLVVAAAIVLVW